MYAVMDGEKVQAMRQERGLSRQELAKEAGVGLTTVRSGKRVLATTGWRAARVFGLHPKEMGRPAPADSTWRELLGLDA
jgi:transcriptional regulator with XRE-family HTH domain